MRFLEQRLRQAEEKLDKALNPRYSSAEKEKQAEYYRQQIEEIKAEMKEREL
jgi:hypothetical protein